MVHESSARSRATLKQLSVLLTLAIGLAAKTAVLATTTTTTTSESELLFTPAQWEHSYQCTLERAQNHTSGGEEPEWPRSRVNLASRVPWWQRVWFKIMHACNRDTSAWRFLYIDEILGSAGFTPRILERSTDERLANIIYTIRLNGLADLSYFKFNSGDPKRDRENERLVAGPEVSQAQCDEDLTEMSGQFDELQERLRRLRAGDSSGNFESRHVSLVRALDTYGRYEPGMLTGSTKLLGAYSQCEIAQLERHSSGAKLGADSKMSMRYCWAKLELEPLMSGQLGRRRRLAHETSETNLQVGICLPRSCHTRTLHGHKAALQRLVDSQLQLPASLYVNESVALDSVFCLADAESEFRMPLSGKLFFVFTGLWLLACCLATHLRLGETPIDALADDNEPDKAEAGRDEKVHKSKLSGDLTAGLSAPSSKSAAELLPARMARVLSHLNLRNSWNDFTSDKRQISATARVDLDVLNPVKLFACSFCIASHAALLLATVANHQGELAAFVERDYVIQAALLGSVVVDTFFVISGFLLTYIILKKLAAGFGFGTRRRAHEEPSAEHELPTSSSASSSSSASWLGSPKDLSNFLANWLVLFASRYFRLVPLYVIMFWFRRDVLTYIGSGPMWDYGFNRDTMNGACSRESWLVPFTPLSAFVPLSQQCYVPSWSISNDILFAFILPPIILLLRQRPKLGVYVTLALLAASVTNSVRGYVDAEPQNRWELGEFRLHGVVLYFNGLSDLYSSPLYRTSSYLVGTLAGFLLFKYDQQTARKEAKWPFWLTGLATPAAAAYLVVHVVGGVFAIKIKTLIYPYQRLLAAFLSTLDRPVWAAANAVLFLRMTTDWRLRPTMQQWASQTWRTLARLNFAILFTHWLFIVIHNNTLTLLPTFTAWQIYAQVASIYLAGLPTALIVHLVFENPLDKLCKRELFGM